MNFMYISRVDDSFSNKKQKKKKKKVVQLIETPPSLIQSLSASLCVRFRCHLKTFISHYGINI